MHILFTPSYYFCFPKDSSAFLKHEAILAFDPRLGLQHGPIVYGFDFLVLKSSEAPNPNITHLLQYFKLMMTAYQ
jgi:hypothetical protein